MLKLLKWPKLNILLVYFVPNYYHFEFHMLMNNLSVHIMLNIKHLLAVKTKTF